MNQRIQALAYEAEDYADSIVDAGGEFHPAYTKKFAELIVKEAIEAIRGESMGSKDEWEDGLRIAEYAVREHFGVE